MANNLHNLRLSELYPALQTCTDRELYSFMSVTARGMIDQGLTTDDSPHWQLAYVESLARTQNMPVSPERIY